jgi:uncharacterized protein YjbI with pentapeptide repeats
MQVAARTVLSVTWGFLREAKVRRRVGLFVAAILAGAAITYLLVWYGPDLIARHDVGPVAGPQWAIQLQQARDAARGRLLTLGAGLFAAAALVYTALNFRLSREGQVTDRYTKAIEQLGSDKLDVRIGGIYALERVARDSARDHTTIMEVLAAFIREHSHKRWPVPEKNDAALPERTTRPDVQAALTVIGRRDTTRDQLRIDLKFAELHGADLGGAQLAGPRAVVVRRRGVGIVGARRIGGVDLTGANLRRADFTSAQLSGARLSGADLTDANLTSAQLSGADLTGANLADADLNGATFTGAHLRGARFTGTRPNASLTRADHSGADLTGADLTGAALTAPDLTVLDLTGAKLDGVVPEGWVRDHETGRLQPSDKQRKDLPSAGVDGTGS